MEIYAICLCIVTVFGHLQRAESGYESGYENDLKSRANERDASPLYVNGTVDLEQYHQLNGDVDVSVQSSSSIDAPTDEKPSSVLVKSVGYEVRHSDPEAHIIETRGSYSRSQLNHSDRVFPAENGPMRFASTSVTSVDLRHDDAAADSAAIPTSRSFRGKRNLDSLNRMLEPVFGVLHPHRHKHKLHSHRGHQNAGRSNFTDNDVFEKIRQEGGEPEGIPASGLDRVAAVSRSAMHCLLKKLPEVLKIKILATDDAEKIVLTHFVQSPTVPTEALEDYNLAKTSERELLKRLLSDVPIILPTYKSLRRGMAWNHTRLHHKYKKFFFEPSDALKKYETLKSDESAFMTEGLTVSPLAEASPTISGIPPETTVESMGTLSTEVNEAVSVTVTQVVEQAEKTMTDDEKIRTAIVIETNRNDEENMKAQEEPFCGWVKVELSDAETKQIVTAHNHIRRQENATNMLLMVWDEALARLAQYKANTCKYYHSMRKSCKKEFLGQNLYTNFVSTGNTTWTFPPLDYIGMTDEWAEERQDWDWTTMTCRQGKKCGHWRAATGANARKVGCGKAQCTKLDVRGVIASQANFVVCDYSPFWMQFEVGERCTNCAKSTVEMEKKGFLCENDLCVPCDPKKKPGCKCGLEVQCLNDGQYLAETCGCKCPPEYYGATCETRAGNFRDRLPARLI